MNPGIEIRTRDLPQTLQRALDACGFHCASISVRGVDDVDPVDMGGDGYQGVFCLVNLSTGEHRITRGSWGGANAFTRNVIDGTAPGQNGQRIALTADVAAIQGYVGGTQRTFRGTVYVHPSALAPLLPAPVSLDAGEAAILNACGGLIGAYRKAEIERVADHLRRIDGLVNRGLLKRNKAGALSITVDGENARRMYKPPPRNTEEGAKACPRCARPLRPCWNDPALLGCVSCDETYPKEGAAP